MISTLSTLVDLQQTQVDSTTIHNVGFNVRLSIRQYTLTVMITLAVEGHAKVPLEMCLCSGSIEPCTFDVPMAIVFRTHLPSTYLHHSSTY
jgi:hypothetical protein